MDDQHRNNNSRERIMPPQPQSNVQQSQVSKIGFSHYNYLIMTLDPSYLVIYSVRWM